MKAALDASGRKKLIFIPAFPKMNRITRQGIHYIDGLPVNESVFGRDPYAPVPDSYIPKLIHRQARVDVEVRNPSLDQERDQEKEQESADTKRIVVYDVQNDSSLHQLVKSLAERRELGLMAGCAGFASVLPRFLSLTGMKKRMPALPERLFVICGSLNPITGRQMELAEQWGFKRIRMTARQKLDADYFGTQTGLLELLRWKRQFREARYCILDSSDTAEGDTAEEYARARGLSDEEVRKQIAENLGYTAKELLKEAYDGAILVTGGDTLAAFLRHMRIEYIEPVGEVETGVVLSEAAIGHRRCTLLSKSGGFGKEDLFIQLAMQGNQTKEGMAL